MQKGLLFFIIMALLCLSACGLKDDIPSVKTDEPIGTSATVSGEIFLQEEVALSKYTQNMIESALGPPLSVTREPINGMPGAWINYAQEGMYVFYEDVLLYATIITDKLPLLRDIKIGESYANVRAKFKDNQSGEKIELNDGSGGTYELLYGEYTNNTQYGVAVYEGDSPITLEYGDTEMKLAFHFNNGILEYTEYQLNIN